MEECPFIKCEPGYLSEMEEPCKIELSVHPQTHNQVLVKNDPQPLNYAFEEELDLDKVKKEENVISPDNQVKKEDPHCAVADLSVEQVEKKKDEMEEPLDECDNSRGSSLDVEDPVILTGATEYSCDSCHKLFNRNSDLKRHLVIHTGEKPHGCTVCSNTINTAEGEEQEEEEELDLPSPVPSADQALSAVAIL
ncbi:zinc finger protein 676 [Anabrus simplex]|uniref:zinc finger protein 676 n=1 Tax=Anabrus simplex TaxID=316456 RepID=UPI0035A2AAC5